ncbi:hypothetical protein HYW54_02680 [Candidatus Gottesmanbacteria bacterium]|nr:hypothetical protein [Candidatus Gottesmanbacteria bacterium]
MPDIFVAPDNPKPKKLTRPKAPKTTKNQHEKARLFSAFSFMPSDLRFQMQEPGETVVLLLRAHLITNIPWVVTAILLLILPFFLIPLLTASDIFPVSIPPNYLTFAILLWYMITFSFVLVEFLLWYFNVSLVTSERILDIDFHNILTKDIAETRISNVEDVDSQIGGFIRSLFDYGDVFVQTAGKHANFEFLAVPHPQRVVKIINQLVGKIDDEGP